MMRILRNIANVDTIERVYAIAASTSGERLMRHLGFEVCKRADARRDNHTLFVANAANVAANVARICDDRVKDRPVLDQLLKRAVEAGI